MGKPNEERRTGVGGGSGRTRFYVSSIGYKQLG
jgi:hypothetical protein